MKTLFKNTNRILRKSSLLLIVAVALVATSCEDEEMPEPKVSGQEQTNIPSTLDEMNNRDGVLDPPMKRGKGDVQRYNSKFKTLRAALDYTGLTETVSENRLTVLAPTDAAFSSLLSALGFESIYDMSTDFLSGILLYHVIPGTVYAGDLTPGPVGTASGEDVMVSTDGGAMFNDSKVVAADIKAMNGVIHAIDAVLLPPSITGSIFGIAFTNSDFSILSAAIIKAGLVETLAASGPFTVFAPNNAAFADLLAEMGWTGLGDIDKATLTQVLLYHAVSGKVYSGDLPLAPYTVTTVQGGDFIVDKSTLKITDANSREAGLVVAGLDIDASNGVIHVIDTVILP